jgi:quinol monooxygenase YgiN
LQQGTGKEEQMVKYGFSAKIVAKADKAAEVGALLEGAVALANQERGTIAWFAYRADEHTFGVFDVFPDAAGRQAHIEGPIAQALMAKADELLAEPPQIVPVDVLAAKLPS